MTDKELAVRLQLEWANSAGTVEERWEAVASRARELLAPEPVFKTVAEMSAAHDLAAEYKHRFSQLDRIEAKVDWLYWWNEGMRRGKPEPEWPEPA